MDRARDLISNICTLESNGKIGCVEPNSETGLFLWRLFSHLLEESRLRTGSHQGLFRKYGLHEGIAPKPTAPSAPASASILKLSQEQQGTGKLFKFGKQRWMRSLLDNGDIRIAPASFYNDKSLGHAIADDELSYDLATTTLEFDILTTHPFQTRLADAFGEREVSPQRIAMQTNYYVWCASLRLSPRLFEDFEADSVLVIHDTAEFSRRLMRSISSALHGWRFTPCVVHYFDPYHPSTKTRNVFACKHFKYLYQKEFRYVFLPTSPLIELEPITLRLGPMHDIAEVLDRDKTQLRPL